MDSASFIAINGVIGIIVIVLTWVFLFFSRIKGSRLWTITVTPLAAIIGSGFLITAPLAYHDFAGWAVPLILLLNVFALIVGSAVRTNIKDFDPTQEMYEHSRYKWLVWLERGSNWVLGVCYVVAIAFYVSLLCYFVFDLFGIKGEDVIFDGISARFVMNIATTAILGFIGIFGYLRGLHELEKIEKTAVNLKMGVIVGLIVVLIVYAIGVLAGVVHADYSINFISLGFDKIQILAGLLLITQGFETVKFMGDDYAVKERNKGMILAQVIALVVYVVFIPLAGPLTAGLEVVTETAIADVMAQVALGMGIILSLAAVFSQSGAAIADTIAGGGLVEEESKRLLNERQAYVPVIIAAIVLVWAFPVFKIITIASRFFALYYLAQTVIAMVVSMNKRSIIKAFVYCFCAIILFAVVIFATPAA
ncbi:hypothetical protein KC614_00415 [candidate division WWE3 bacterium]|uniref:Uncharacterized protein n=1 Tax=candidate division WWE3 bacterium TaxID=2053526 RepID=A0A955LJ35_UNCKA|nr:hypothetical protein [candidate division WWE3 bacterium]